METGTVEAIEGAVVEVRFPSGRTAAEREALPVAVDPPRTLEVWVGYQPTLPTALAEVQERIASTIDGAIISVQAV